MNTNLNGFSSTKPLTNGSEAPNGEYVSECWIDVNNMCANKVFSEQSFFSFSTLPSSLFPTKKRYGNRDAEGSTPGTCVGPESHLKTVNPGNIVIFSLSSKGTGGAGSRACVY